VRLDRWRECDVVRDGVKSPGWGGGVGLLFTSSFQAVLSAGALLGGLVVDASSVSIVMVCGGLLALLTTAVLLRAKAGT
jgi:predicted MFS family arabinose efflux permease